MPHALHQFTRGPLRQAREGGVARGSISAANANLDELVIGERAIELEQYALGQPRRPQHHDRMQRVGEPAQIFFLFFGQRHRRIVCRAGA